MSGYKQDTHARATWPPVRMVEMEKQLGESMVDFILRDLLATGAIRTTGRNLERLTGIASGTIRDWWKVACGRDPGLRRRARRHRDDGRRMNRLTQDGLRLERDGLLAEIGQVKNGMDGVACQVCGAPLPTNRTVSCDETCAELWAETRYHISEAYRASHLQSSARWTLAAADTQLDRQVRYAKRVLAGETLEEHGRWVTSKAVRHMLEEVMERRAQAKDQWGDLAADLPPIRALEKKSA